MLQSKEPIYDCHCSRDVSSTYRYVSTCNDSLLSKHHILCTAVSIASTRPNAELTCKQAVQGCSNPCTAAQSWNASQACTDIAQKLVRSGIQRKLAVSSTWHGVLSGGTYAQTWKALEGTVWCYLLTCEEDGKKKDEQKILAGLAHLEPAAALFAASSSWRPAASQTHTCTEILTHTHTHTHTIKSVLLTAGQDGSKSEIIDGMPTYSGHTCIDPGYVCLCRAIKTISHRLLPTCDRHAYTY